MNRFGFVQGNVGPIEATQALSAGENQLGHILELCSGLVDISTVLSRSEHGPTAEEAKSLVGSRSPLIMLTDSSRGDGYNGRIPVGYVARSKNPNGGVPYYVVTGEITQSETGQLINNPAANISAMDLWKPKTRFVRSAEPAKAIMDALDGKVPDLVIGGVSVAANLRKQAQLAPIHRILKRMVKKSIVGNINAPGLVSASHEVFGTTPEPENNVYPIHG